MDGGGNLYVADTSNNRIRKITPGGIVTTVAGVGAPAYWGDGGPAVNAALSMPKSVAVDAAGVLHIADTGNSAVRRVTPDGVISTELAGGVVVLTPNAVAVDPSGAVYVAGEIDLGNATLEVVFKFAGGNIVNVAGAVDRHGGFSGDGGPANSATLDTPGGLALDPEGNLFIADTGNQRIRKVDTAGIITTFAGNGLFRYAGDGGPATSAPLDLPTGIAIDPSGNLYLSEQYRHHLRRVGRDGVINTFAPGADLYYPNGLAADSAGNIYVADEVNSLVRKISPDGVVSTVAGNGNYDFSGDGGRATAAALQFPTAVAVDAAGALYIADTGNQRIRQVDAAGTIRTVAGSGNQGYYGDGAAATSAALNNPAGVALAPDGTLYLSDTGNHRVRRVTPDGVIRTVAGNGTLGFSGDGGPATSAALNGPQGLAFDAAGNLYIADTYNHRIRRVTPGGTIETVAGIGHADFVSQGDYIGDGRAATSAWLSYPTAVAVDGAGNLYIADQIDNRVRVVLAAAPAFQLSPERLDFAGESGGPPAPAGQIRLAAGVPRLAFSTSADVPWLSVSVQEGYMPASVEVTANPADLAPGTYTGTVRITAPFASPGAIEVAVGFTVGQTKPAQLAVRPATLTFALVHGSAAASQTVQVANDGGGTVNFTVASDSPWLQVSSAAGTAPAYGSVPVVATADPAGLAPGTYSARLTVAEADGESRTVAVVMTVSAVRQSILLPQAGLTFTAVAGGGTSGPQTVLVRNGGEGVMNWTSEVSTVAGAPGWLSAGAGGGASDAAGAGAPLAIGVNPAGLEPGVYYGQVRIVAAGADNSPQSVTAVLNVLPAAADPGPVVEPSGLVFSTVEGTSPGSQNVTVTNLSAAALAFSTGRVAQDAGTWLNTLPAEATVPAGGTARVVVQPVTEGLAPGVYRGTVNLSFAGSSRTVNLLVVVKPSPASASASRHAAGVCVPGRLLPIFTSLGIETGVPVGWPNQMVVRVVDDCANPMTAGSVVVNFSTGDPQLSLTSGRDGNWLGVWQVRNTPLSQITLKVTAEQPESKLRGTAEITGGLRQNQDPPVLNAGAIVSSASLLADAPLAPGTLVSIFGSHLAESETSASGLPLPNEIAGTVVALAGVPLPLLSVSDSRIDAVVPYEIAVNTRLQMIVRRGASYAIPELVTVAPAQPALFTKDKTGSGQALVYLTATDGAAILAQPETPAKAGDGVVFYSTGLGAVDPALPAGTAVPDSPVPHAVNAVTLTIGGVDAPVSFAGLLPGLTGVYQVRATVPEGAVAGEAVPVVLTSLEQSSPPVTMAVK